MSSGVIGPLVELQRNYVVDFEVLRLAHAIRGHWLPVRALEPSVAWGYVRWLHDDVYEVTDDAQDVVNDYVAVHVGDVVIGEGT